jgi:hypothetical protein
MDSGEGRAGLTAAAGWLPLRFVRMMPNTHILLFLAAMLAARPAGAVIVAGIDGKGKNNDTQAGLVAYLADSSQTAFPYWNNLVRVNSASGVYLGYNPSTMRGWVLTAQHVGVPSSITVAGSPYTVAGGTQIGSSDLRLLQIGGGVADPMLPLLPTVPIASAAASVGDFLLMFGRASTNSTSAPYPWVAPGSDEANGMRWGTNTIEGKYLVNIGTVSSRNDQPYLVVDFDGPTDAGATAYDAQGAAGDSGGGLFIERNGIWELSGIAHFVDDGPDFLEAAPTGDNAVKPSQYGDFTAYTDTHSYAQFISGYTGTLIPEPGGAVLLLAACGLCLRRHRADG